MKTPAQNRMVLAPAEDRHRPGQKLLVRYPPPGHARFLSPAGDEVAIDGYWTRRLQSGDVVAVPAKPAPKEG